MYNLKLSDLREFNHRDRSGWRLAVAARIRECFGDEVIEDNDGLRELVYLLEDIEYGWDSSEAERWFDAFEDWIIAERSISRVMCETT